jgi:predicted DNA-binding transcriptional regulator AlpA
MSRTTTHPPITAHDLMDGIEVAAAFGVSQSSLQVALSVPDAFPSLAAKLPAPIRKIGRSWVWLRSDVEAALAVTS